MPTAFRVKQDDSDDLRAQLSALTGVDYRKFATKAASVRASELVNETSRECESG